MFGKRERPIEKFLSIPDFNSLTEQQLETLVESNEVTVTADNAWVFTALVRGGDAEFNVNNTGWVKDAVFRNGDTIKLRATTSANALTETVINLYAQSLNKQWSITTSAGTDWTPAELGASLALWLDAEDSASITLNGSTVSQWDDKSGNGRNISQAVASQQPTWNTTGLNGKPTIDFDGTNDFLKNATFEPAGAVSCFLVFNRDSNNGAAVVAQRTDGIFEIGGSFGENYRDITFTATGAINPSLGFDLINGGVTQDIMLVVQYDGSGTNATDFTARLNGASQAIVNSSALGYVEETGFSIGGRAVQDLSYYNGRISELIFTNSQSPLSDVQKIEGYLAWKWGLAENLPADHPYKTTPPTT